MKIYRASEKEIDDRLRLDRRQDKRAFCRYFENEEELPSGFYDLQDKIRDGLEDEFYSKRTDGTVLRSWDSGSDLFHFPAELLISERILIEMSDEILDDKIIGLLLSYFERCAPSYCAIVAVYRGMQKGSEYLGRFVINISEIAVEASLCETWCRNVNLLELE